MENRFNLRKILEETGVTLNREKSDVFGYIKREYISWYSDFRLI